MVRFQYYLCNSRYYISFVDNAACYCWVQLLSSKSDAVQATIEIISKIETHNDCRVKSLRTNNGGEYLNEKFSKYLDLKGINHDLTPPYSPESNGVAKRLNCLLCSAKVRHGGYADSYASEMTK